MPSATDKALLQEHGTVTGEQQFATSIWFEDIMGNVAPPERILWARSPMAKAVATPSLIPLGVPTQVTVHASDLRTGVAIPSGTVWVDDQAVGTIGVPFTFTFNTRVQTEIDREFNPPRVITTVIKPIMTVTVPDYPDALVSLEFFKPSLTILWSRRLYQLVQLYKLSCARRTRQHTHLSRVVCSSAALMLVRQTHLSTSLSIRVTHRASPCDGLSEQTFGIPLFVPTMQVSVSPSPIPTGTPVQVTVRAIDTRTGLPVNGRVKLNGVDTLRPTRRSCLRLD